MEEFLGENPHKRLIKELLVEGKIFAVQLQSLLKQPNESVLADELIRKIWGSLTQAITVLNSLGNSDNSLTQSQIEEVDQPNSGSGLKMKKEKQDRRGCYKRRKTSGSWMRESETMNDGCAWRKYGQKKILNSKYPRCYYRCTHKYDQECRATKQVQIIQENPIKMYHTTYFGNHTCNSTKIPKHTYNSQFNHAMVKHSDSTVLKEEEEEEEESKGQSDNASSIVDSNLWQDFMPSSPSAHDSTLAANYNAAYYEGVISSHDMEDLAKFGEIEAIEFC